MVEVKMKTVSINFQKNLFCHDLPFHLFVEPKLLDLKTNLSFCVCVFNVETLIVLLSSFQWPLFQLFSNRYEKPQLRNLPMNHCRSFPLRPGEDDIDKVLQYTMPK